MSHDEAASDWLLTDPARAVRDTHLINCRRCERASMSPSLFRRLVLWLSHTPCAEGQRRETEVQARIDACLTQPRLRAGGAW